MCDSLITAKRQLSHIWPCYEKTSRLAACIIFSGHKRHASRRGATDASAADCGAVAQIRRCALSVSDASTICVAYEV
eukprot:4927645-Pleurochrysis_carterae.AAC.1